jgi:HEAT repeat protein
MIRDLLCIALLLSTVIFSCACSITKRKPPEKNKSVDELVLDLSNEDDDVKVAAIRALATSKDRAAVAALIVVLKNASDRVAVAAATALGDLKAPQASEALWALIGDPTQGPAVRLAAARSLALIGDIRAAGPLVRGLSYNFDAACAALVGLGKPAVPALIDALGTATTRNNASKVLIAMGDAAVEPLIDLLRHGQGESERWGAAATLAEIEDPRAEGALDEALKNPDPELTWKAYRFLIRRGQPGTEARLISALNTYGRIEMAEDFIASGNPVLKAAAEDWSRKKSYRLAARTSDMDVVHWGGVDSSIKRVGLYHFDNSLASTTGTTPLQAKGVSFVPGKWGSALSVAQGGILSYPLANNLSFKDGTIEMWISPKFDGTNPVYSGYNHALLLYHSPGGQFLVSESTGRGFYAGSVTNGQHRGSGGGDIREWKAGTWHHIAFTYCSHPTRQRFYVDGQMMMESTADMPAPGPGADSFTLGCDLWGNLPGFVIDELQISSAEKSSGAIRASALRKAPFPDH